MYDKYAVYVRDVVKSYGSKEVLHNFCMTVEKGSIYGLLGSSGCGKTTILTSVVGRTKVDSGEIWILGEKCGGVPGRKVGYMPQNTALVAEFTVKDAIFYFGRIFEMDYKLIVERYQQLHEFLNLPPGDRYIKNCSGGEQRRVSFAAALVHHPQLLILDEPSVGLDPLLRDRIWSYFVEITTQEKITIIITTHYIEEARQADKVGLMRGGKLLVQDFPNKLINQFQAETLEEVFLTLSLKQDDELENANLNIPFNEGNLSTIDRSTSNVQCFDFEMDEDHASKKNVAKEGIKQSILSKKRMLALLDKNCKQMYRNPLSSMFLVVTPLVQSLLFLIAVGGDLRNIPLAIVNDENITYPCSPSVSTELAVPFNSQLCHLNEISCRFLEYLDVADIKKLDYNSVEEGKEDVRRGNIIGVLHIYENFSRSLESRINNGLNYEEDPFIGQAWLDMSEYPKANAIKYKIIDLYTEFQGSIYTDCGYLANYSKPVLSVQEYVYGDANDGFIIFMTPAIILTLVFFFGLMMTSTIVVTEKCEGIWDRSIVAGVTSLELTLSHFILQASLLIVMVVETMVAVFAIFQQEYVGSLVVIFVIIYLQGICGLVCGFWVSSVSTNHVMAHIIISGFSNTATVCSGFMWPLEGIPTPLRIFSKCMPFTIPIVSLRNVIKKGWGLTNPQILTGIGVMAGWTLALGAICVYIVKTKR